VKRIGFFLGISLVLGTAVAALAYLLGDEEALVFSATALGICLVPAVLTMAWAEWAFRRAPHQFLVTVLGGTGLRLFVVLGAALAVNISLAYFQKRSFFLWVLALYVVTLVLETAVLLAGRTDPAEAERQPQSAGPDIPADPGRQARPAGRD
jgi:uncharacterized membrane protein YeiH